MAELADDLEVSEALLGVFVVRHRLPCPLNLHPVVAVNLTHSMGWVNHGPTGSRQPHPGPKRLIVS